MCVGGGGDACLYNFCVHNTQKGFIQKDFAFLIFFYIFVQF